MICKACGNTMSKLVDDLYLCSGCTLISSTIMPDVSIYDKSYVLKYQRYEKTDLNAVINSFRFGVVHEFVEIGKVLDYGCGVGSFLKYSNVQGILTTGYDVNPYGDYCDPVVLLDNYEAVTLWDSIEHIVDPVKLLRGLKPKYVFICTPSTDDFKGQRNNLPTWRHYMPEEHVHYFNEKSLIALLKSAGYDVVSVSYGESEFRKGGSNKNILTIGGKLGSY